MIDYPMPDRMGQYSALADVDALREQCQTPEGLAETRQFVTWMEQASAIYAHNLDMAKRLAAVAREALGETVTGHALAPWARYLGPEDTNTHRQAIVDDTAQFDRLASTVAGRTALREIHASSVERLQAGESWIELAWAAWLVRTVEKALSKQKGAVHD